jgi:hypothetical protein
MKLSRGHAPQKEYQVEVEKTACVVRLRPAGEISKYIADSGCPEAKILATDEV